MKRALLSAALLALAAPVLAEEPPKRSALWTSYCTVCHGDDGKAATEEGKKKGARDLTDPKWQAAVSDDRLASSLRRGRDKMPPFGRKLKDEQIKELIAEVRSLVPKK